MVDFFEQTWWAWCAYALFAILYSFYTSHEPGALGKGGRFIELPKHKSKR